MRLLFSEAAARDRQSITQYTAERFGVTQVRRLRDAFEGVFASLLDAPHLGRRRPGLDPAGHEFRYFVVLRRFIVVFEPTQDGLRVARILHGAKDIAAELDRDSGADEHT